MAAGERRRVEARGAEPLGRLIMGWPSVAPEGRIVFKGQDLAGLSVWQRAQRGLFFASGRAPALPGLSLAALLRAGLSIRRPDSDLGRPLRSRLAERCRALGLSEGDASRPLDEAPAPRIAWKLSLLALECLQPELAILCPPDEAGAEEAFSLWPGSSLLLMEKPANG